MTATDTRTPVDTVLSRLVGVKKSGAGFVARCPGHDDHDPSLSISEGEDGRALLKCFTGCDLDRILGAISLTPADLFVSDRRPTLDSRQHRSGTERTIEYLYLDPDRQPVKLVRRFPGKQFRQFRPDGQNGWAPGIAGVEPVPYRLPDIIDNLDAVIFVCEGEGDCETLAARGLVATTTGSASSSPDCLVPWLRGRTVVCLPDHDEPGETYMAKVTAAVGPVAASIQTVRLPGLGASEDVSDYLAAGHTFADLLALVDADPPLIRPDSRPPRENGRGESFSGRISGRYPVLGLAQLDALDLPERDDVIDGIVPTGSLALLSGREKGGKSLIALDMGFAIAGGDEWAGRSTLAGPVIYAPAEDSIQTVRKRLRLRSGGEMADGRPFYVAPISGESVGVEDEGGLLDLGNPAHLAALRATIEGISTLPNGGRPTVILDCLRELHAGKENDSDSMSAIIRPLRQLVRDLGITLILIHHAGRLTGDSRGSTAIGASCDSKLFWSANGDDPDDDGPIRGVLSYRGRDTPKGSIRLEMGADLQFRTVDLPADAGAPNARGRILTALADGRTLTADDIEERTGIPKKTVQNVMSVLLRDKPATVARVTGGRKGDPSRYRSARIDPKMIPPDPDTLGVGNRDESEAGLSSRSGSIGGNRDESRDEYEPDDEPDYGQPGFDGPGLGEAGSDRWTS